MATRENCWECGHAIGRDEGSHVHNGILFCIPCWHGGAWEERKRKVNGDPTLAYMLGNIFRG